MKAINTKPGVKLSGLFCVYRQISTSGKFDMYGKILDESDGTLGDLKVTSSFKLMKALGIYKVDAPTGEVFKTGA